MHSQTFLYEIQFPTTFIWSFAYFEELPKSYFSEGLKKLEGCLTKSIELQGDYVEKWKKITQKKFFPLSFPEDLLNSPRILDLKNEDLTNKTKSFVENCTKKLL